MWVDANKALEISDYYKPSLERKMFRPPFIQFYECTNILIENVKIINSPFWTVNPAFCDNVTIHGRPLYKPSRIQKGRNTGRYQSEFLPECTHLFFFYSVGADVFDYHQVPECYMPTGVNMGKHAKTSQLPIVLYAFRVTVSGPFAVKCLWAV